MKNEAKAQTACRSTWPVEINPLGGYPERYAIQLPAAFFYKTKFQEGYFLPVALECLRCSPFGAPHFSRFILNVNALPKEGQEIIVTIQAKQPLLIDFCDLQGRLLATVSSGR